MGKPRIHLHPRSVEEGSAHGDLNESNLLAMKDKAEKHRTHHVGTKLNEVTCTSSRRWRSGGTRRHRS
ncbi:hypothetical protein [Granulicella pectinivorans]|uniref:hypothetical protein n=1 Tax=Granulicella pectinivorans TaxID=474950 RepID=UPI00113FF8CB|nr:hypothetical protein [Granulicella pectinivorans]